MRPSDQTMRTTVAWLLSILVFGGAAHGQTVSTRPLPNPYLELPRLNRIQWSDRTAPRIDVAAVGEHSAVSPAARSPAAALGIEALGGTGGSAIGFHMVRLLSDRIACGENLSCTLGNAATALLLGSVGAAAVSYASGRIAGTEPSGAGAVIGAVVGAAAVVGVDHVLSNINTSDRHRYVAFAVTQGLLTAIGSRIGALLR